jgi:hypothetical protein
MPFERERRYIVFKIKDLSPQVLSDLTISEAGIDALRGLDGKPPLRTLIIESDWPEYEPVWEEIQRRMEGRPTIMDEELGRWQQEIYELVCECAPDAEIDGGGSDGDALEFTLAEISQGFIPGWLSPFISWIICGPENGHGKRSFDGQWAMRLQTQAKTAGVPFFYKAGLLNGKEYLEVPA